MQHGVSQCENSCLLYIFYCIFVWRKKNRKLSVKARWTRVDIEFSHVYFALTRQNISCAHFLFSRSIENDTWWIEHVDYRLSHPFSTLDFLDFSIAAGIILIRAIYDRVLWRTHIAWAKLMLLSSFFLIFGLTHVSRQTRTHAENYVCRAADSRSDGDADVK